MTGSLWLSSGAVERLRAEVQARDDGDRTRVKARGGSESKRIAVDWGVGFRDKSRGLPGVWHL